MAKMVSQPSSVFFSLASHGLWYRGIVFESVQLTRDVEDACWLISSDLQVYTGFLV